MLVATTAMIMITRERNRLEVWDMERLLLDCCEWLFSEPIGGIGGTAKFGIYWVARAGACRIQEYHLGSRD